ncbi:MAG: hypothetical protein ACOYOI_06890, partial [Chthoniobacterales bacterium]
KRHKRFPQFFCTEALKRGRRNGPKKNMGSSLFGVGRNSKQSAVLKNEGLIRNSAVTVAKQRPG